MFKKLGSKIFIPMFVLGGLFSYWPAIAEMNEYELAEKMHQGVIDNPFRFFSLTTKDIRPEIDQLNDMTIRECHIKDSFDSKTLISTIPKMVLESRNICYIPLFLREMHRIEGRIVKAISDGDFEILDRWSIFTMRARRAGVLNKLPFEDNERLDELVSRYIVANMGLRATLPYLKTVYSTNRDYFEFIVPRYTAILSHSISILSVNDFYKSIPTIDSTINKPLKTLFRNVVSGIVETHEVNLVRFENILSQPKDSSPLPAFFTTIIDLEAKYRKVESKNLSPEAFAKTLFPEPTFTPDPDLKSYFNAMNVSATPGNLISTIEAAEFLVAMIEIKDLLQLKDKMRSTKYDLISLALANPDIGKVIEKSNKQLIKMFIVINSKLKEMAGR